MRAHTFARAQITYHIHHEIPILRYQEGFEDQEWDIIMKKGNLFYFQNLYISDSSARKMVLKWGGARARHGARLIRHPSGVAPGTLQILRVGA